MTRSKNGDLDSSILIPPESPQIPNNVNFLSLANLLLLKRGIYLYEADDIYKDYNFPALVEELLNTEFVSLYKMPAIEYQKKHNKISMINFMTKITNNQFRYSDNGQELIHNIIWDYITTLNPETLLQKATLIIYKHHANHNDILFKDLVVPLLENKRNLLHYSNESIKRQKFLIISQPLSKLYSSVGIPYFFDDGDRHKVDLSQDIDKMQLFFILRHYNNDGKPNDLMFEELRCVLFRIGFCPSSFYIKPLHKIRKAIIQNYQNTDDNNLVKTIHETDKNIDKHNKRIHSKQLMSTPSSKNIISPTKDNMPKSPGLMKLMPRLVSEFHSSIDYIDALLFFNNASYNNNIKIDQTASDSKDPYHSLLQFKQTPISTKWVPSDNAPKLSNHKNLYIAILGNDDTTAAEIISYFTPHGNIDIPSATECVYYECGGIFDLFNNKKYNLPSFLVEMQDYNLILIRVFSQDNQLNMTNRFIIEKYITKGTFSHIITCRPCDGGNNCGSGPNHFALPSLYHHLLFNHFDENMYIMVFDNYPPPFSNHIKCYQKGKLNIDIDRLFNYGIIKQTFDPNDFLSEISKTLLSFQYILTPDAQQFFKSVIIPKIDEKILEDLYSYFKAKAPNETILNPNLITNFYAIQKMQEFKCTFGIEPYPKKPIIIRKVISLENIDYKPKPKSYEIKRSASTSIDKKPGIEFVNSTISTPIQTFINRKMSVYFNSKKFHGKIELMYNETSNYIIKKKFISTLERRSLINNFKDTIRKTIINKLIHNQKFDNAAIPIFPFNIFDEHINQCIVAFQDLCVTVLKPDEYRIDSSKIPDIPTRFVIRYKERLQTINITQEMNSGDQKILDDA